MKSRIIRLAMAALAATGAAWAAHRTRTCASSDATSGATDAADPTDSVDTADTADSGGSGNADSGDRTDPAAAAPAQPDSPAPRISALQEVRDGGYAVGSAAPIADGAMPLGHPVKAWEDTRTYAEPGQAAYAAPPHVWFRDAETAAAAGFDPAP